MRKILFSAFIALLIFGCGGDYGDLPPLGNIGYWNEHSGGGHPIVIGNDSDGSYVVNSIDDYRTVRIGEQVWMAENLNYYVAGSKCYDSDPANCAKYGRLYDWNAAMEACPSGWHLPSDSEWNALMDYAYSIARDFAALPSDFGGFGDSDGNFGYLGYVAYWWSADELEFDANSAYFRGMDYNDKYSWGYYHDKSFLISVRCVQDRDYLPILPEDLPEEFPSNEPSNDSDGSYVVNSIDDYRTVRIGEQVWMAENLNYYVAGSKCYDSDPANCAKYGRLYDWNAAMEACPSGWHLPSDSEWNALMDYAGYPEGTHLKATYGWHDNGNGVNAYGFAALPGGHGNHDGSFGGAGYHGFWWSATEDDYEAYNAYGRYMEYALEYVYWNSNDKSFFFSVRCIQDYIGGIL